MAKDLIVSSSEAAPQGWAARMFGKLGGGRGAASEKGGKQRFAGSAEKKIQSLTQRLVADDRYIFVLLGEAVENIEDQGIGPAWKALDDQMALVPAGVVQVVRSDGAVQPTELTGYYLDRCAVTNQQFQRFVNAGGTTTWRSGPKKSGPA